MNASFIICRVLEVLNREFALQFSLVGFWRAYAPIILPVK
jgi:hypothetical protein